MRLLNVLILASAFSLASVFGPALEAKEKWVCKKDGEEVKVKGKAPKDKQKSCEENGGTWEKSEPESQGTQSSGSGGAW